jgi:hypothetical protein
MGNYGKRLVVNVQTNEEKLEDVVENPDQRSDNQKKSDMAKAEIQRLEGQITIRRIRDAYKDSTWMDAQEALIKTQRDKL